jgi:hypothetical protein
VGAMIKGEERHRQEVHLVVPVIKQIKDVHV